MSLNQLELDELEPYYYKHEPEKICGIDVKPITQEYTENYPSIVDRFFTRYYFLKPEEKSQPYKILFHSNRICLICLAPEHPALKSEKLQINFNVGNADRSKNTVSGKGKKGGMPLQADSTLCIITTYEGTYKVPSCIRGKLIEINSKLSENPEILKTAREGENFIAIILPKPEHCEELKSNLLSEQNYKSYLVQNASVH